MSSFIKEMGKCLSMPTLKIISARNQKPYERQFLFINKGTDDT